MDLGLDGKAAIVTGGSRGIGAAVSLDLAQQGCDVALTYRGRTDAAAAVVVEIEKMGRRGLALKADVSSLAETEQAMAAARPLGTTAELASVIKEALSGASRSGRRRGRIHPATRTFQALRIAVNHELENLETLLASGPRLLKENGTMAVISFHSLEDGMVKRDFKQNQRDGVYRLLTKKPIVAEADEIAANRRARSAKLRIAQRNCDDQ